MIDELFGEQYKGKEKLLKPNLKALQLGSTTRRNSQGSVGLKVKRANAVGDKIFIEGNTAAALGVVYGGATVCAWYPITPSSSLAEAFQSYCRKLRVDPASGKNKFAIVQAEDELASIGIVTRRRLERRARLHRDLRPGHLADDASSSASPISPRSRW